MTKFVKLQTLLTVLNPIIWGTILVSPGQETRKRGKNLLTAPFYPYWNFQSSVVVW